MKRALICGISGQDGGYLARLLLAKGYEVWGTSRDAAQQRFEGLVRLGIRERVSIETVSLRDVRSIHDILVKAEPDEIYNLSGQTSVALSFQLPAETVESITLATLNLLEAVRMTGHRTRIYNASSSECFGNTGETPANEATAFRPRSPYGAAKASAHWLVANYRDAYGLYACSGILFNHDSPLRPERFVTQKVVRGAVSIAEGRSARLTLGSLDVARDWGAAEEYVDAMWRILQCPEPDDFVVATGETRTLEDFVACAFEAVGLDWREHVDQTPTFQRASDIVESRADPSKAERVLGWRATRRMQQVVEQMVDAARNGGLGER